MPGRRDATPPGLRRLCSFHPYVTTICLSNGANEWEKNFQRNSVASPASSKLRLLRVCMLQIIKDYYCNIPITDFQSNRSCFLVFRNLRNNIGTVKQISLILYPNICVLLLGKKNMKEINNAFNIRNL